MNFKIFASKNGGQFESDLYGQFNRYMHYNCHFHFFHPITSEAGQILLAI